MYKRIFFLVLTASVLFSCNQESKNSHGSGHDDHSTHDKTDTASADSSVQTVITDSYFGILPCADCGGIETTLSLKSDYSYQLHQIYKGRKSSGPGSNEISTTGKWMKHGADTIHLRDVKDAPSIYVRTDSSLIQLDMQGKRIEGKLADKYILKKSV